MAAGRARCQAESSALTSIRSAWKVRLPGWPPLFCEAAGTVFSHQLDQAGRVVKGSRARSRDDGSRDPAREPLLPVLAQDALELGGLVRVENVGRGEAAARSIRMSRGASWL